MIIAKLYEIMKIIKNDFDTYLEQLDEAYLVESFIELMTKQQDKSIFNIWVDLSAKLQSIAEFDGIDFAEYFDYLKDIYESRQSRYFESDHEQVDAHHIIPRNLKILKDNDLDNLIALTREQHIEAHAKFLGCLIKSGLASTHTIINASGAVYLLDKYKLKDDLTADEFTQLKKDIADGKRLRFLKNPYVPKERHGRFGVERPQLTDTFTWIWADGKLGQSTFGWNGIIEQVKKKYGVELKKATTEKWSQRYNNDIKNGEVKEHYPWQQFFQTFPKNITDVYKNHSEDRLEEQSYIAFKCSVENEKRKIDFNSYEYGETGNILADKIALSDSIPELSKKIAENKAELLVGELPTHCYYNNLENQSWVIIAAKDLELLKDVCDENNIEFKTYKELKEK